MNLDSNARARIAFRNWGLHRFPQRSIRSKLASWTAVARVLLELERKAVDAKLIRLIQPWNVKRDRGNVT